MRCVCCVLYRLAAEQSDVLSDLGLTEPVDKLQVRPSITPTRHCIPASSWCPSACSRSSAYHITTPPTPYTLETYLVIMTGHHDVQAFCATLVLPHSPSLISSHSPTYALIHALTPPPHPPTHSPPPPTPHSCQVRIFNLDDVRAIRDLDPIDIDSLVAIKGMVTRTGNIIPDLRWGRTAPWLATAPRFVGVTASFCMLCHSRPSFHAQDQLSCLTMDHPWTGMKAAFLRNRRKVAAKHTEQRALQTAALRLAVLPCS
jgi:hypothetical protein